jgi:hypothetical protein
MDLFTSTLEDKEMSLRELAMPSMEDIEMQKSDLALATTHYEVKPGIIKLVATKPFRGLDDDNPYRNIKEFTMLCNTVQQEGVPAAWIKWNLFPFSLEDEARRWYTLVSIEAKGNWDELVKKFCHTRFYKENRMHLICAPGSIYTHMTDKRAQYHCSNKTYES